MLGYMTAAGQGAGDRLLFALAARLRARGLRLAGAVQENRERGGDGPCDMDLHVLSGGGVIRISQRLGRGAAGCRLDAAALEAAVGLALAAVEAGAEIVVVNKFGKQEAAEGRGFRPVFAAALERGLPVLTAVSPGQLAAFLDFAGGLAEPLPADAARLEAWALGHARSAAP